MNGRTKIEEETFFVCFFLPEAKAGKGGTPLPESESVYSDDVKSASTTKKYPGSFCFTRRLALPTRPTGKHIMKRSSMP